MKKDLKKRLEKAIATLKEPGGSTIRSIVKVINKGGPILSLRKVLEALQEGINEGFLCMYNGRFKLNPNLRNTRPLQDEAEQELKTPLKTDDEDVKTSESENEESDGDTEADAEEFYERHNFMLNKTIGKPPDKITPKHQKQTRNTAKTLKASKKCKKQAVQHKKAKRKLKIRKGECNRKGCSKESEKAQHDSFLEIAPNMPENKLSRPTTEKPDLKKQRGPRCTSMKKDVRMPSKVHIPFVPPSVPQRTNNFNDLLRRSPEPFNGPLFDGLMLTSNEIAFFSDLN